MKVNTKYKEKNWITKREPAVIFYHCISMNSTPEECDNPDILNRWFPIDDPDGPAPPITTPPVPPPPLLLPTLTDPEFDHPLAEWVEEVEARERSEGNRFITLICSIALVTHDDIISSQLLSWSFKKGWA